MSVPMTFNYCAPDDLCVGALAVLQVSLGDCADYDPSHALDLDDASRMNQMHEAPLLDLLHRWASAAAAKLVLGLRHRRRC